MSAVSSGVFQTMIRQHYRGTAEKIGCIPGIDTELIEGMDFYRTIMRSA